MKKEKKLEDYNDITKRLLNELADDETIYEEVQTGPQEELTIQEYKFDLNKFKEFKQKKKLRK